MLARVAERMYWFGRYLERAENTARLIDVNGQLTLDLPQAAALIWKSSTDVIDSTQLFMACYGQANERNVVRFMLADQRNLGSLICSVRLARENVRNSREVLPSEVWEIVNKMYHFVRDNVGGAVFRRNRSEFLDAVVGFAQRVVGLLVGTMSHTEAYRFVQIGASLERADMTSRIADVGAKELFGRKDRLPETHDNIRWTNVLLATSAYQMYRQYSRDRVTGPDVVDFLFRNPEFPRTVVHCLNMLRRGFLALPRNESPAREVTEILERMAKQDFSALSSAGLHALIDDLQLELGNIHTSVERTWFARHVAP